MSYKVSQFFKANLPEIVQTLCYVTSVGLFFPNTTTLAMVCSQLVLLSLSFVIKLFRIIHQKKFRKLMRVQLSFYVNYIYLGFQIFFLIRGFGSFASTTSIALGTYRQIIQIMMYSLLLDEVLCSLAEAIIYSIGLTILLVQYILQTIAIIDLFQQAQGIPHSGYYKEMILLTITTGIGLAHSILSQLYRVFDKKMFEQPVKEKSPIQIELSKTVQYD